MTWCCLSLSCLIFVSSFPLCFSSQGLQAKQRFSASSILVPVLQLKWLNTLSCNFFHAVAQQLKRCISSFVNTTPMVVWSSGDTVTRISKVEYFPIAACSEGFYSYYSKHANFVCLLFMKECHFYLFIVTFKLVKQPRSCYHMLLMLQSFHHHQPLSYSQLMLFLLTNYWWLYTENCAMHHRILMVDI